MTFTGNEYIYPRNYELWKFLMEYAKKSGIPLFNESLSIDRFESQRRFGLINNNSIGGVSDSGRFEISYEEFLKFCDNFLKERNTIKLTNEYTALINLGDREVEVGCQKIPFSKIDELYNIIHK